METIQVNGVDLHYAEQGPIVGPAVMFCNSLGTDLRVWDLLLPHLPAGLRILRYDKRGHGLSEVAPGPYTIDDLADDAAALIRERGLTNVVFVGLSIGGVIGQALAARHGDLLAGLVISNSAAKIGEANMWRDRIAAIKAKGLASIAPATMERWFSPAFRQSGHAAPWQRMLERQPLEGYAACCEAIAAADLRAEAARLALPVQLIAGTLDGATPPEVVRGTADMIAGSRYDQISDAGHIPCVETPARYAEILTRFLQEIGHV
ncbi:3-oxoadipate enol-lactonase [Paracoccus rhizosphaerae]|uniref:3-oxoadipate enol-lactonase n=1 Tax=Paracoccus rhizosphaerae TaxID=1133347 RepID=A0ABV6CMQ6_9RHOB|nr:3-oxoadipate enol-lactonase [Paracoccus rhizosphaerae]